jgi:hypothetical protein
LSDASSAGWPGRVAVAIVRSDPPEVYLARDVEVLSRLVALSVVARTPPGTFAPYQLPTVRAALLEERWADAVLAWIEATGLAIDAYPDEEVWTAARLDADAAAFEIRLSTIFDNA